MSNQTAALSVVESTTASLYWEPDEIDVIKNVLAKGITDNELKLFAYQCKRTGLDPFTRQIYAVVRGSGDRRNLTIQVGIDGLRLIADRTGSYCPGRPPTFEMNRNDVVAATAYVMKLSHGQWFEVSATAYYSEYVQLYDGKPMGLWGKMPRTMLAKCAEALAIRKAFPSDTSGIYTDDEMAQATSTAPFVQEEVMSGSRTDQQQDTAKPETKDAEPFDVDDFRIRLNKSVEDRRARGDRFTHAAKKETAADLLALWGPIGSTNGRDIVRWAFDIPELEWYDLDVASVDILGAWSKRATSEGVLASRLADLAAAARQWMLDNEMDAGLARDQDVTGEL